MAKVFISYSSKDSSTAKNIAEMLRDNGIEPWLAEDQILPGDKISEKIQKAIKGSEYFVVLLSQNSLKSKWVSTELGAALSKAAGKTGSRIIPVILDDVQLPTDIRDILYIDLRQNFKDGIEKVVSAVSQPTPPDTESLSNLVDTEQVAKELEKDQIKFKGAGYLITTILGIATLIVSGISSFSSFQQSYKNRPQVFYSVNQTVIEAPPNVDPKKFSQVLISNQIAPTTLQVDIINKGDTVAKEVQAGILLPQNAMYSETKPPASPAPIWVKIETKEETGNKGTYYTYKFKELIQEKPVKAFLGYGLFQFSPSVEVIYDGKPANRVRSIEEAKAESFVDIFKTPIEIFITGLIITLIAGFIVVLVNNRRLRDAMLLVIKELNPTLSKTVDLLIKITRA